MLRPVMVEDGILEIEAYPKQHHARSHEIHYIISLFELQSSRTDVFLSSLLLALRASRDPHDLVGRALNI